MTIRNQINMSFAQRSFAAFKQHESIQKRRRGINKIKPSMIAVYASVFALVISVISISYHQPQDVSVVANAADVISTSQTDQTSVDDAIATNVAAGVAQTSNLPVANSVSNLAVSARIKSRLAQSGGGSTAKPQIIESAIKNRLVTSHIVVPSDTVDSLAKKYGISVQTIKWANNLTTDVISVGSELKILPVDGVLYSVKADDTIDSIATKYKVDKTRLSLTNDIDVSGLEPNTSIILPDGTLPETERPGYVAPFVYTYSNIAYGYSGGNVSYLNIVNYGDIYAMSQAVKTLIPQISNLSQSSDGNKMNLGNCTWWAWERRLALGKPLPSFFGNAGYWGYALGAFGYKVDKNIAAGDVFESGGHVGIVESLNYNDLGVLTSFTTSEMNYPYTAFNVVSRTIPASNINDFNYIH